MNVRILNEVYTDARRAVDWYNEKREGLGDEFEALLFSVLDSLPERTYHHAIDVTGYRALRLPRFTAVLYYTVESGEIVVAGVMVGGRSSSNLIDRW